MPGETPSTAIVMSPEINIRVPVAGSQLKLNVRLESGLAVRGHHVEAGPLERGRPGRLGEGVLHRRDLRDREDGDDDRVGRVGA